VAIVLCGPTAVFCSAIAGIFLLSEIVNGLIPTRWFSDNATDWLFGTGTEGSARGYFGFILSTIVSSPFWAGANWGISTLRRPRGIGEANVGPS